MTRWFPIAPGTTLPAAPAAVGGQITVTKTVPAWNETVLITAKTRNRLQVTTFGYAVQLLTEVIIKTRTVAGAARALPSVTITTDILAPSISVGASVTTPVTDQSVSVQTTGVATGASVFAPAIDCAIAALQPQNAGSQATVLLVPSTTTSLDAPIPAIAIGTRISAPTADIALAALTPIETDPSFSSVSLLLHCDGTNGSTTFTDNSPSPSSVSVAAAQVSTAQSKFGGASCLFGSSGGYLNIPTSSKFAYGTADFTIEFWYRRSASGTANIYDGRNSGVSASPLIYLTSQNYLTYFASGANRITTTSVPTFNAWVHIALSRVSGSTRLFLDGTQIGSTYSDTTNYQAPTTFLFIGNDSRAANIDEVRITKGVGRYGSGFTAPAAAFPDQ